MKTTSKSVGSFDAKTHLSNILDEVQKGVEFIITKRGRPVAKIIKYKDNKEIIIINDIILQFDKIRNSVKGKVNIKEYMDEGRKY